MHPNNHPATEMQSLGFSKFVNSRFRILRGISHNCSICSAAPTKTAVLYSIILRYSGMVTSVRDSKSMSYCCPSQTSKAVLLKVAPFHGKPGARIAQNTGRPKSTWHHPKVSRYLSPTFHVRFGARLNGASSIISS